MKSGPHSHELVPATLPEANGVVARFHRHHRPVHRCKFQAGLTCDGRLVGAYMVGRPVSRHVDDGVTLEIVRVAVEEGHPNAASKLLGAAVHKHPLQAKLRWEKGC